tara:strand:+ start:363 stop:476 length:114 start_codon:yes stop_codon:yes gene_type:complete
MEEIKEEETGSEKPQTRSISNIEEYKEKLFSNQMTHQ